MFEVYVHVPFCLRRCGYCDFNTYTAVDLGGGATRGNYARMAIHEMHVVRAWQLDHGIEEPKASSVFFGGGTPTILPAEDLAAMLDAIRSIWGIDADAEITTEANPDTVDAAYIAKLAHSGFTRISLGMQSAVGHVLHTLDRTHTPANVTAAVRAADAAGIRSSVDLIYGTPGESIDDWRTSVNTALELGVRHISAYALTIEPTTKMGRQIAAGSLPHPDDDDEAAKYEIADSLFAQAGLAWYEISNWSVPGYESRHNLGYWRNVDWAGIGPGAHSHYRQVAAGTSSHELAVQHAVPTLSRSDRSGHADRDREIWRSTGESQAVSAEGSARHTADRTARHTASLLPLRAWDIAHPRRWGEKLKHEQVPWRGYETLDRQQDLEERVMLGMRLREGLDVAGLERSLTCDVDDAVFDELHGEGLIEIRGSRCVPTLRGRLLNDAVIGSILDHCTLRTA